MKDHLDIYFNKARESLSEPVSIAEIKSKLNDAPIGKTKPSVLPRHVQVVLGSAVMLGGLYFLIEFLGTNEEDKADKATIQQEEVLMAQPQDASVEEATTGVQESMEETNLTVQTDKAPTLVQNDELPEPIKQSEENLKPEPDPPVQTAEGGQPDANPVIEPEPEAEPEAEQPASGTMPAIRDQAEANGGHRFEILSTSTRKDLRELDKTLSKYGIKMNVKVLEYDREWISKFNGYFEDVITGNKSKFNISSLDFDKLVFTFKYSESTGPLDMRSAGE
jgi:hypothetical protein